MAGYNYAIQHCYGLIFQRNFSIMSVIYNCLLNVTLRTSNSDNFTINKFNTVQKCGLFRLIAATNLFALLPSWLNIIDCKRKCVHAAKRCPSAFQNISDYWKLCFLKISSRTASRCGTMHMLRISMTPYLLQLICYFVIGHVINGTIFSISTRRNQNYCNCSLSL